MVEAGDAFVLRAVERRVAGGAQGGQAADVVGMVMGDQHRGHAQALCHGAQHRRGVAGVDHDGVAAVAAVAPDVVVIEGGQGGQGVHK